MNLKNMKKFIKTNKTTPPINLGVWFFICEAKITTNDTIFDTILL